MLGVQQQQKYSFWVNIKPCSFFVLILSYMAVKNWENILKVQKERKLRKWPVKKADSPAGKAEKARFQRKSGLEHLSLWYTDVPAGICDFQNRHLTKIARYSAT